jgi:serine/threonine protein kinase
MKGTVEYIAPEMITSEEYGFSVDFYSLGLVIYEMLSSGEHPFKKPDRTSMKEINEDKLT